MTLRGMRFGRYDVAAFLGFSSYAACAMVAPVALVAVAEDLKFPLDRGGMSAGGMLHLGRSLAMVGTMLLCGFLAARWGMRRSVGYSLLLMGMATLCCALAPGYGWLLAATVAAGFGEGVFDGLISPFVRDLHREEEPGRYVNFTHGFWSFGVLTAVLVYGALLYWGLSWRGLFVLAVLVTLVPVLLLLLPESRGAAYPERREAVPASRIWAQSLEIMARPRFWLFFAAMLLAGGGEFCLTFWCATFIQMHFSASALAGGIGTAAFAAGMFLGRTGGGRADSPEPAPAAGGGVRGICSGGKPADSAASAGGGEGDGAVAVVVRTVVFGGNRHRAVLAQHSELCGGPVAGNGYDDGVCTVVLCRNSGVRDFHLADGGDRRLAGIAGVVFSGAAVFSGAGGADRLGLEAVDSGKAG